MQVGGGTDRLAGEMAPERMVVLDGRELVNPGSTLGADGDRPLAECRFGCTVTEVALGVIAQPLSAALLAQQGIQGGRVLTRRVHPWPPIDCIARARVVTRAYCRQLCGW